MTDLFPWLGRVNERLEQHGTRLLLAVDEYESLDLKIGSGTFPDDLLAALRDSIQSHRRISWVLAGSHDITELVHAPWPSYLVSMPSTRRSAAVCWSSTRPANGGSVCP